MFYINKDLPIQRRALSTLSEQILDHKIDKFSKFTENVEILNLDAVLKLEGPIIIPKQKQGPADKIHK